MRALCLRFCKEVDSSWAELFLRWSPRVVARPPNLIFLEIEETASFFGGEEAMLAQIHSFARDLASGPLYAAVADSLPGAQLLSSRHECFFSGPGREEESLRTEPLSALRELEGLRPWLASQNIGSLIESLQALGLETIGELMAFPVEAFRERWGSMGILLWNRLHRRENQALSPLLAIEPLYRYLFFEHSIGQLQILRSHLDEAFQLLFLQLAARACFAKTMEFHLHGEYSKKVDRIEVTPVTPGRDRELFLDLLLQKLAKFDFENPIKEIEIRIHETAERVEQLNFFEPRETSRHRWERLISMARAADLKIGFLKRSPALYPENAFHLEPSEDIPELLQDHVEIREETIQIKPSYGKELQRIPRPALLRPRPVELSARELSRLKLLTTHPVERIMGAWWNEAHSIGRDYFLALSPEGRLLWVYRDCLSKKMYLHGAFD